MTSTTRNESITRRALLKGAGAAGLSAAGFSTPAFAAAEFQFKFARNLPATHPLNVRAKEAADRIAKESGGKVELQIFPANQLGADADLISQLRAGGIDFLTISGLVCLLYTSDAAD